MSTRAVERDWLTNTTNLCLSPSLSVSLLALLFEFMDGGADDGRRGSVLYLMCAGARAGARARLYIDELCNVRMATSLGGAAWN